MVIVCFKGVPTLAQDILNKTMENVAGFSPYTTRTSRLLLPAWLDKSNCYLGSNLQKSLMCEIFVFYLCPYSSLFSSVTLNL
jgi:hypothetical protein